MISQKFKVVAAVKVTRQVLQPGHAQPISIQTVEVRASPEPMANIDAPAGWSANTPTLDIGFTVWGPSVTLYVPGFTFELSLP